MFRIENLVMRRLAQGMLAVAVSGTLLLHSGASFAQTGDNVVARVGDHEITERELGFAQADLAEQFAKVPEEMRRAAILDALIDIKLLALEAEKEGMADEAQFQARVQFLRDRALHNKLFEKQVLQTISEADIRARYDAEIASMKPAQEIRARHILVKTEEEAKGVIAELDAGKDFAEAAKEHSTGPSGVNGGDLDFFGRGQMVPEFEEAAFALANGDYTRTPVQTQFGWHVIKREEDRTQPPPAFENVKSQVREILMRERYAQVVADARTSNSVEILDDELRAKIEEKEAGAGRGDQ